MPSICKKNLALTNERRNCLETFAVQSGKHFGQLGMQFDLHRGT